MKLPDCSQKPCKPTVPSRATPTPAMDLVWLGFGCMFGAMSMVFGLVKEGGGGKKEAQGGGRGGGKKVAIKKEVDNSKETNMAGRRSACLTAVKYAAGSAKHSANDAAKAWLQEYTTSTAAEKIDKIKKWEDEGNKGLSNWFHQRANNVNIGNTETSGSNECWLTRHFF